MSSENNKKKHKKSNKKFCGTCHKFLDFNKYVSHLPNCNINNNDIEENPDDDKNQLLNESIDLLLNNDDEEDELDNDSNTSCIEVEDENEVVKVEEKDNIKSIENENKENKEENNILNKEEETNIEKNETDSKRKRKDSKNTKFDKKFNSFKKKINSKIKQVNNLRTTNDVDIVFKYKNHSIRVECEFLINPVSEKVNRNIFIEIIFPNQRRRNNIFDNRDVIEKEIMVFQSKYKVIKVYKGNLEGPFLEKTKVYNTVKEFQESKENNIFKSIFTSINIPYRSFTDLQKKLKISKNINYFINVLNNENDVEFNFEENENTQYFTLFNDEMAPFFSNTHSATLFHYLLINNLSNNINNNGSIVPLIQSIRNFSHSNQDYSQDIVDQLSKPISSESYNSLINQNINCTICLEKFCKEDIISTLPCMHLFHKDCFNQSFKLSARCPLCKFDIIYGLSLK